MDSVYERVRADKFWDHLRLPGIRLVPGFGSYAPRVLLVGEAPGATENLRGRPFCGASGKALEILMGQVGLRATDMTHVPDGTGDQFEANAFLTNVVKYRPPNNRTPTHEEIVHGRIALRQEWAVLGRPRVIVALGRPAQEALLPNRGSGVHSAATIATPQEHDGTTFWPMYHPAFPLRMRRARPRVEEHWTRFGKWLEEHGYVG